MLPFLNGVIIAVAAPVKIVGLSLLIIVFLSKIFKKNSYKNKKTG